MINPLICKAACLTVVASLFMKDQTLSERLYFKLDKLFLLLIGFSTSVTLFQNIELFKKYKNLFINILKFLAALLFASIVSLIYSSKIPYQTIVADYISLIGTLFLFLSIVLFSMDDKDFLKYLILSFILSLTVLPLMYLLDYKTLTFSNGRFIGLFSDPNYFANFMIIPTSLIYGFFIKEKTKIFKFLWYTILCFTLEAVIWSNSRSGWLGLMASLGFLIFVLVKNSNEKGKCFLKNIGLLILAVLIGYCLLQDITKNLISERIELAKQETYGLLLPFKIPKFLLIFFNYGQDRHRVWSQAWKYFSKFPLGYGLGYSKIINIKNMTADHAVAHSLFFEILLSGGILLMIVMVRAARFFKKIYGESLKCNKSINLEICVLAAFFGSLISSLFLDTLNSRSLWVLASIILSYHYYRKKFLNHKTDSIINTSHTKKILQIVTLSSWGGAQQSCYDLAYHLKKENFEIEVACKSGGLLVKKLEDKNIKVHQISSLKRDVSPINDLKSLLTLYKLIKNQRYDIVHCHSTKAGILGRIAAYIAGVPFIYFTVRGWGFYNKQVTLGRNFIIFLEKILANYTTKIICVSENDMNEGIKNNIANKEKFMIIKNGVSYNPKTEREITREVLGLNENDFAVGMVARITFQKNPILFLNIAKEIVINKTNVKFILIGNGVLFKQCKKFLEDNRLENKILLLGEKSPEETQDLLQSFDLFLLTSIFEGLPLAIIEAMFSGLPIIASNVGGVRELVHDTYNGFLINNNSKEEFIEKIINIIENKESRKKMGENSIKIAGKNFRLERVIEDYKKLYVEN